MLLSSPALAQSPVSEADVARAAQHRPQITDAEMARAAKVHALPPSVHHAGSASVPAPVPSPQRAPQPEQVSPVDVAALAREVAARGQMAAQALPGGPQLLVFISLSMPEGALQRLMELGARAKAVLVLRGLEGGSLIKTMAHVHKLLGQRQVALQIDPQAFDRFGVRQVPTFVLLREGSKGQDCDAGTCFAPEAYLSVAGDVTIDYALEHIASRAPRFAREAQVFLNRIKD
ncbi:type-F conjugative transfer system pilin assembly protein TrbC [Massilia sp. BJB1822]|uniref:type-F conjugative transfer system pilin assembly protein TrbC n=1 Tax=Massilia sp. BJB1822 TaxID=2744470 RepID=UPI001593D1ED|nr:type-F conjugative transfer system pilin assembly protein TrbC [Massilia sp. BJB1822]NVD97708.1 type-F conjugative transfer system pilin assembly protein TrbC [Massilia sp. BJB1822]